MGTFITDEEAQMLADARREANENAQRRGEEPEKTPEEKVELMEGYKLVNVLSVLFILVGVAAIIGGGILANNTYSGGEVYFIGGFIAAIFCFGWAVVTRVCALYIREHDK